MQHSLNKAEKQTQLKAERSPQLPFVFQQSLASQDHGRVTEERHLPRVKDPWSATGWPRTGLEHHQPIVHLSQKLGVYTLGNVGDLVWI